MRKTRFPTVALAILLSSGLVCAEENKEEEYPLVENVTFEKGLDSAVLIERSSLIRRLRWRLEIAEDDSLAADKESFAVFLEGLKGVEALFSKLIPDEMVARERLRINSRLHGSLEGRVRGEYGYFLALLERHRSQHKGTSPDRVEMLLDGEIFELPTLDLPNHPSSALPRQIRRVRGDSIDRYLKDSGRWLYIADPRSAHFGLLVIDCSHKSRTSEVWHDVRSP